LRAGKPDFGRLNPIAGYEAPLKLERLNIIHYAPADALEGEDMVISLRESTKLLSPIKGGSNPDLCSCGAARIDSRGRSGLLAETTAGGIFNTTEKYFIGGTHDPTSRDKLFVSRPESAWVEWQAHAAEPCQESQGYLENFSFCHPQEVKRTDAPSKLSAISHHSSSSMCAP